MSNAKRRWGLVVGVLAIVAAGAFIGAKPGTENKYNVKKQDEQVVLYTLYRGNYDDVGASIGKLFQLAGQHGISPRGPLTFSYLNNPMLVEKEHRLTEIRIPVGRDALKHAGKLGEMTDVKVIKPHVVVTCTKPAGVENVEPLWTGLMNWVASHGYVSLEGPREVFLSGQETGNYADMETEVQLPVEKSAGKGDTSVVQ